ncbi:MAG TPA: DUF1553 domain-containing protein, partial [Chthoniobacteraceae bacterium]|nr:DUF1553 domain-containing protein [Chthoniobacteraceae bacterium]
IQDKIQEYLIKKQAERAVWFAATTWTPLFLPASEIERNLNREERDRLREERNRIAALDAGPLAPPRAMILNDAPKPVEPRVFIRGNPGRPGDPVPRRFLTVLSGGDPKPFQNGSGRLELARAIASRDNPLTARVIVNRVWMHHFGKGLVRTPGDFGVKGEAPTHPELLDWLASNFVDEGWSLKKLHRAIMLSSTYQQVSDVSPDLMKADPENRMLSRMNRRRLDFESMRDSLLCVTGELEDKVGGRAEELTQPPFSKRRAIYGFIDRQNLPGTFRTFDFASPDSTNPQRFNTTVPQQALFMLNSPFVIERAKTLAGKPEFAGESQPSEWQVQHLYQNVLRRAPEPTELQAGLEYISAQLNRPKDNEIEVPLWQYGYGAYDEATTAVTFEPFKHFAKNVWQPTAKMPNPDLGFVQIHANGGHTGRDRQQSAIRRWTAPQDATVSIAGVLSRPSDQGDGVIGRVIHNSKVQLAKYDAAPKANVETRVEQIEVKRGDTIDFLVECGETDNSDSFEWAPLIRSEMSEWDAKIAFAGPPPPKPPQLKAWEKYAQVLLATNEFVFID